MRLLLLSTFVATIFYVNAGKKQRLMAGMNGGMANGANPGMMGGGFNPMVPGGAGFIGQPQFAPVVPRVPAYAMPPQAIPPVPFGAPNIYPVPQVNALPYMGVPGMAGMNPFQQQGMGVPGGAMQQQFPFQADLMKRFKRHIMTQANSAVDTQIPAPTESTTTTPCNHHQEDN